MAGTVATAAREKVYERLVAWIWDRQALVGALPADDGHTYQVVFRGRCWGERSLDFQGAVLARDDGVLLRGDVEIHVRASDWYQHGHDRNPAYDRAVCQVVLWQDDVPPVRRPDGVAIPTIELITRLAAPLAELERQAATVLPLVQAPHPPAIACVESAADLEALLDRAGVARFLEHAAGFEGDLAGLPPDEVLYRGVLRALGYTANTVGFAQLGRALPLATLRALAAGPRRAERLRRGQAALLGVAGLLPSQRGLPVDAEWPRLLEAAWAEQAPTLDRPLPPGTWKSWRVRPENAPVRRAAGMSHLVGTWADGDPVDRLLADLEAAGRAAQPTVLADHWEARAEDDSFWATHHDFGRPLKAPQPGLVGAGRAGEIAVNVLLPFGYALGQASGDGALAARALELYRRYPSGPPNRVVREMAAQVGGANGPALARGACRQQGLIHLYRHWCDTRDCASCAAAGGGSPGPPTPERRASGAS